MISHYYPRYVIAVTTDLTVKYLRPITEGVLKAVARITHIKEPMALITVELRNKSNELIGTSTATYWVTLTNKSLNDLINELRGKT
ncbi:PaaI family thioesterase [Vulcanisaeta sp. JCM 16161]|uniref:PaaI family thioesterase n=1 Tax=Vulcanisaeta sp. JCM 16161 TaxID=1295372 RepID=UPI001FB2DDB9|nr:PaaI family thioesterase [Vulcanisaeta sp. JCM 16161]